MKKLAEKPWLVFFGALALGVFLHFVHHWLPNSFTALISPVRESIWEHLKTLYIPLLLAALLLGRGEPALRTARLLVIPIVCALMLGLGWLYHIALRQEGLLFDLALYAGLMLVGFLLPRRLWLLAGWPGVTRAAWGLVVLLGGLMAWFTFLPPDSALFADLSGAVRTFLTIPV